MKEAYEIYVKINRLGGQLYIRKGKLCAGPASLIPEDLRASILAHRDDIRALASVLQGSLYLKIEEMVDEVFANDKARFFCDSLEPEQLLSYEEIERRLNERVKKI